jgi:hypothetical protein
VQFPASRWRAKPLATRAPHSAVASEPLRGCRLSVGSGSGASGGRGLAGVVRPWGGRILGLDGTVGQDAAPPVMSMLGIIHFGAIIFALGTAVFILALVKERNEAASNMAARIDGLTGIANRAAFMESAAGAKAHRFR